MNPSNSYTASHEPPAAIVERLAAAGSNPHGEPLFRLVWGEDRFQCVGAKWHDYDDSGNLTRVIVEHRWITKYQPEKCWHLEIWLPPDLVAGTRAEWNALNTEIIDGQKVERLGEYPSRGEYELIEGASLYVKNGPEAGKPVPLTDTIIEALVTVALANRELSPAAKRAYREKCEEARARAVSDREDAILDECRGPFSPLQPYPGRKTKIEIPTDRQVAEFGVQRSGI